MAATPSPSLGELPFEMIAASAGAGYCDAERVIAFLNAINERATFLKPITRNFLLHLGAGLRLASWEEKGFFFHRAEGLPNAQQVIHDAMMSLNEPDADPHELCLAVHRLTLERFAWSGPPDMGSDMALDELTDDGALDLLAEYLWASRRAGGVTETSPS
jgi:hypothetical protein